MKRMLLPITLLAVMAAGHASAQTAAQTIKPGLWELNSKMKTGNAQTDQAMGMMFKQLANMPPDQRAQLEAMMAKQGVTMPQAGSDGGMKMTTCVTPEMIAKQELPMGQKGKCKWKNDKVAGGMNVAFTCTDPASSGNGQIRFVSENDYTATMNISTTLGTPDGKPQNVTTESTGHWLGATCPAKPK
jgi:hypothetical protein